MNINVLNATESFLDHARSLVIVNGEEIHISQFKKETNKPIEVSKMGIDDAAKCNCSSAHKTMLEYTFTAIEQPTDTQTTEPVVFKETEQPAEQITEQAAEICGRCRNALDAKCSLCVQKESTEQCHTVKSFNCGHSFHYHCYYNYSELKSNITCLACAKPWYKNELKEKFVLTIAGVQIEVTDQTKVAYLYEKLNLDVLQSYYITNNKEPLLNLEKTLKELDVTNNSVLAICDSDFHSVTYEIEISHNGITHKIFVQSSDKFDVIKSNVQQYFGLLQEEQKYEVDFDKLAQGKSLKKLGLTNSSKLTINKSNVTAKVVEVYDGSYHITQTKLQEYAQPNTQGIQSGKNVAGIVKFVCNEPNILCFSDMLTNNVAWIYPFYTQSQYGVSCMLSALYVATNKLSKLPEKTLQVLGLIRSIIPNAPHVINAFKILFEKKSSLFRTHHCACIVNALTFIVRKFAGGIVPEDKLLGYSHYVLAYLILNTSDAYSAIEKYTDVTLSEETQEDVKTEFHYIPLGETVSVWTPCAIPESLSNIKHPNNSWKNLIKESFDEQCMRLIPGSSISGCSIPSLTLNKDGTMVVITGKDKGEGSSVLLFNPLTGATTSVDPKTLSDSSSEDSLYLDSRKPEEAIMICLDISTSMSGKSGFTNTSEDSDIPKFKEATYPVPIGPVTAEEVEFAINKLSNHPNILDFQKLVNKYESADIYLDAILKNICNSEFESENNRMATIISKSDNKKPFYQILLNPAKILNNGVQLINSEPVCRISGKAMINPVQTSNGYVYDKDNIVSWYNLYSTEPVSGQSMKQAFASVKLDTPQLVSVNDLQTEKLKQEEVEIKISVMFLNGIKKEIKCYPSDTIKTVKSKLGSEQDIRLIFAGKQLDNEKDLQSYNIKTDSTIHAILTLSIETNKKFHVTIESRIFWEKIHLSVDSSDSVRSLKYKLWAITKTKPKEMTFGINIHKGSDGYTFYNSVSDSNNMNQIYNEQTEHKDYKINITVYKKEQTVENTDMDRLSVTKQLFHAFINRSNAYNFPIQIGLMLFGTEVKYACPITPLFEKFKVDIDKAKADGDTKLYDALDQGCQKLMEFRDKQQEEKNNVSLRIIVLTDGDDTMSKIKAYEVAGLMQRQQIVCDAIMIGEVENNTLKNIAKASGGYSFQPSTLQHAMKLCELEVMLARSQRPIKKGLMKISNSWDLEKFKHIDNDICNDDEQPSHKNQVSEVDYKHKFTNLEKMNEFVADTMHSSQIKRLVSELNKLMKDKHPNIDIYIMGDNVTKWHMVITGADSTVYANGCWLVSCNFPNNYPMSPPEIRFITPIKHCNINSYGRVCHSVLDHEYTSDMGMRTIFDCVYGLLLQPDVSDPLDSVLALSFFQASGEYETQIINHTNKYAKRTRGQWQKILVGK